MSRRTRPPNSRHRNVQRWLNIGCRYVYNAKTMITNPTRGRLDRMLLKPTGSEPKCGDVCGGLLKSG